METTQNPSRRSRTKTINFDGYRHVDQMSRPERTAHALDWAAQHCPRQWVAYNLLLKAIMGYRQMPKLKNQEVAGLRSCMSRVRGLLAQKYNRGLVVEPGVGCRATADDEDVLKTDMVVQAGRLASASRGYARTAAMIDPAAIPQTRENERWLRWFRSNVRPQLAQIQSPDYLRKLLPPKGEETT